MVQLEIQNPGSGPGPGQGLRTQSEGLQGPE